MKDAPPIGRPAFGTAPIRCGKKKCKWRGLETSLKRVPYSRGGAGATQGVCPVCSHDSYYFMTPKETSAWNRKKAEQLCKFYGVTDFAGLVQAMERRIEKLQAKLSATPSLAPQHVREG